MSAENIGMLATVVATFLAIVTTIIIVTRYFLKIEFHIRELDRLFAIRLEHVESSLGNKIDAIRDGVNQTIRQSNGMLGLFGTMIGLLSKRGVVEKEDFGTILKDFTQIGHIGEINPNPLSTQEVTILNGYIRKARQGGIFTRAEVEEYNSLVRKLEAEKPNDPDIMPLAALAALLLGLYLANEK